MSLLNVERDTETIIDYKLKNLAWEDHPHSKTRTVWKQTVKTEDQKKKLKGKRPDYTLYPTDSNIPLAVIEAKKQGKDIHAAIKQGVGYAKSLGAPLVFATDGVYTKTLHIKTNKPLMLNGEEIDDLIRETLAIQYIAADSVSTLDKRVIKSRGELISIFSKVNDLLREEGLQKGIERFTEFANILFLKVLSEMEAIRIAEGQPSQIKKAYRWETFREMRGETLVNYVRDTVLQGFSRDYGDNAIFQPLQLKHPDNLRAIIGFLDDLQLSDTHADIKGDAFEYFIRAYSASNPSDLGEIFTPRHIVKTMVKLLNPKIGEKIYDPFCGTGGMLIVAYKHMMDSMAQTESNIRRLQKESLYGTEITRTASIAKMNMILAGDGHSNISRGDSFENPVDGKYEVVITNFPFAQKTRYGERYLIPSRNGDHISPQHCFRALKPGGRMAFIAPDGFLSNTNHKAYEDVRHYLLDNATLTSTISLPRGAFLPYNKVKASILVFTDCQMSRTKGHFWAYDVQNDGYTLDTKRTKIDGENDFEVVLSERDPQGKSKKHLATLGVSKIDVNKVITNKYVLHASYYKEGTTAQDGNYQMVALGDLFEKSGKDKIGSLKDVPIMSITMKEGLIDQKDKFKKRVASKDLSKYKKVYEDELVVGFPIDEGVLGFQTKYPYAAVSPAYSIWRLKREDIDICVLEMILRSDYMRQVYKDKMQGSVERRRSIKDPIFEKIQIPIPTPQVRAKIKKEYVATEEAKMQVANQKKKLQRVVDALWGKVE